MVRSEGFLKTSNILITCNNPHWKSNNNNLNLEFMMGIIYLRQSVLRRRAEFG